MPACRLRIQLRPERPVYRPGDVVQGEVVATCEGSVQARKLEVRLGWSTTGNGNTFEEDGKPIPLFTGDWPPGARSYPFRLTIPPGPPSSTGEELGIRWGIRATANLAWVPDVRCDQPIRVESGPDWKPALHGPQYAEPEKELQAEVSQLGCATVVAAVLVIIGSCTLASAGSRSGCGPWIMGPLLLVLGVVLFWFTLKRGIAAKKLGHPEIHVATERALPGETVHVTVRLTPRAAVQLGPTTLRLRGEVRTVKGSGRSAQTMRQALSDGPIVELSPGGRLGKGQALDLEGAVHVPSTARATLSIRDNKIRWWIEVRVAVIGWPDWARDYPLTVVPTPSAASPPAP